MMKIMAYIGLAILLNIGFLLYSLIWDTWEKFIRCMNKYLEEK